MPPMWPELIEDVQIELGLLHKLLDQTAATRRAAGGEAGGAAAGAGAAGETEKLAAAALLQSFYNGVENVLDAVAGRVDGDRPSGADRHERLLAQLAEPRGQRPAVVSAELREGLGQYLEFRNSFRYGHWFRLDWPLMAALVGQLPQTLERLEAELDAFVRKQGKCRLLGRAEMQQDELPSYWFAPPLRRQPMGTQKAGSGPVLLACLIGVLLGWGAPSVVQLIKGRTANVDVPAAEIRKYADPLASSLRPCQSEPAIAHAVGVLEFFRRDGKDGWQFTAPAGQWAVDGQVQGRCPSLDASATLAFAKGSLVRINLSTPWDQYVFLLVEDRLRWVERRVAPSGRPRSLVQLAPNRLPTYIAEWTDDQAGPVRRDRFFRDGLATIETLCWPDGTVRQVTLRTGPAPADTATFTPTPAGPLAPTSAPTGDAGTVLKDLGAAEPGTHPAGGAK
jgi:hypothetical protein